VIMLIMSIVSLPTITKAYNIVVHYRQCIELYNYTQYAPYTYPAVHEINACTAKGYDFGHPVTPPSK
jgi:hypothetical protein